MHISNNLKTPYWPTNSPISQPSRAGSGQQTSPTAGADKPQAAMKSAISTGQNLLDPTTTAALLVAQEEASTPSGSTGARTMMSGADPAVREKWDNAEKETGYNPLVDSSGKIVGSSFLASYMEMEYRLANETGAENARNTMADIFSNPDKVKELMNNALERASAPLDHSKSAAQLQKEIDFYQSYLKEA